MKKLSRKEKWKISFKTAGLACLFSFIISWLFISIAILFKEGIKEVVYFYSSKESLLIFLGIPLSASFIIFFASLLYKRIMLSTIKVRAVISVIVFLLISLLPSIINYSVSYNPNSDIPIGNAILGLFAIIGIGYSVFVLLFLIFYKPEHKYFKVKD